MALEDWANAKVVEKRQNEEILLQIVHENRENLEFSTCQHLERNEVKTVSNCRDLKEKATFHQFQANPTKTSTASFYDGLHRLGMHYGPRMQLLCKASVEAVDENEARIGAEMRDCFGGMECWALVEFGLQTLAIGLFQLDGGHFFLPVSVESARWNCDIERALGEGKV